MSKGGQLATFTGLSWFTTQLTNSWVLQHSQTQDIVGLLVISTIGAHIGQCVVLHCELVAR